MQVIAAHLKHKENIQHVATSGDGDVFLALNLPKEEKNDEYFNISEVVLNSDHRMKSLCRSSSVFPSVYRNVELLVVVIHTNDHQKSSLVLLNTSLTLNTGMDC